MTPDDVHDNEMPKLPDDQWPADDPVLASFAEDLRMVAGGPAPEPRPGLVAVMRQGAVPVEPTAGRKKMLVKSILGSLAAKVALGVGVAAASVTAAGAAGMLPAPAQDAVASVVAATTPFQLPTSSDVTSLVAGDDGSTTTSSTVTSTTLVHTSTTLARTGDDDAVEGGGTGSGTDRTVNHGACVSTAAKDKSNDDGNHGKTVSSVAKSDCGKDATGGSTSTTIAGGTTTTSSTTTSVANGSRTNNSGPGSSNSGKGNSGNGNSGKGNSGN